MTVVQFSVVEWGLVGFSRVWTLVRFSGYLVSGTRYQLLGTRYMVPLGTWYQVHGTGYLVLGTWNWNLNSVPATCHIISTYSQSVSDRLYHRCRPLVLAISFCKCVVLLKAIAGQWLSGHNVVYSEGAPRGLGNRLFFGFLIVSNLWVPSLSVPCGTMQQFCICLLLPSVNTRS